MLRNANADGLALFVGDALGQFLGGGKDERVRTRRQLFEQTKLAIVDARIGRDFRQIAADQRELVMAVEIADPAQAFGGLAIVEMTAERVAGVGRIGDHRTVADALGDLRQ
jgi:hypothetical protein